MGDDRSTSPPRMSSASPPPLAPGYAGCVDYEGVMTLSVVVVCFSLATIKVQEIDIYRLFLTQMLNLMLIFNFNCSLYYIQPNREEQLVKLQLSIFFARVKSMATS